MYRSGIGTPLTNCHLLLFMPPLAKRLAATGGVQRDEKDAVESGVQGLGNDDERGLPLGNAVARLDGRIIAAPAHPASTSGPPVIRPESGANAEGRLNFSLGQCAAGWAQKRKLVLISIDAYRYRMI